MNHSRLITHCNRLWQYKHMVNMQLINTNIDFNNIKYMHQTKNMNFRLTNRRHCCANGFEQQLLSSCSNRNFSTEKYCEMNHFYCVAVSQQKCRLYDFHSMQINISAGYIRVFSGYNTTPHNRALSSLANGC